jgi:hypothetical protein
MCESGSGQGLEDALHEDARIDGLTEVSCASCICSVRPIKSTSGLSPTHSLFSVSSAAVRSTLSGDCRPFRRVLSAVWTSAGRTDMLFPAS